MSCNRVPFLIILVQQGKPYSKIKICMYPWDIEWQHSFGHRQFDLTRDQSSPQLPFSTSSRLDSNWCCSIWRKIPSLIGLKIPVNKHTFFSLDFGWIDIILVSYSILWSHDHQSCQWPPFVVIYLSFWERPERKKCKKFSQMTRKESEMNW